MEFEGFPLVVGWELTLACNLRCEHCGSTAGLPRANELSTAEALAICDQLPDLLVYEVDFTGGEPLLHPDWPLITRRLRELKIHTKLITNGLLLTPETVAEMKDAGMSRVGVSIDGLEATHDAIRKHPGLFRQVLAGVELLQKAGIPVAAITTVNGANVHQLPALLSLFQSIGIDFWQYQPLFPLGRAQNCQHLALSEDAYLELGAFSQQFYTPDESAQPILSPGDSFGYFTRMDQREPPWGGCSAGLVLCGITSDGRVKGCLSMPDELAEGDLRQQDLWDIWFDEQNFRYNRCFSTEQLGANCQSCERAAECQGGCSSMSYAYTGQFHNDPLCFLAIQHAREKSLAWKF